MIIGKIRDVFKVKNGKELSVSRIGKMSNGKLAVWWERVLVFCGFLFKKKHKTGYYAKATAADGITIAKSANAKTTFSARVTCIAQQLVRISNACKASVKATFSFVENVLRVPAESAMKTSKRVRITTANTHSIFHSHRFHTKHKGEARSVPTTTVAIRCNVANAKYSVETQSVPTTPAKASSNISQKFRAFIDAYIPVPIKEVYKNIHTGYKAGLLSAFTQKTKLAKTIKMTQDVSVTTADTSQIEGLGTETMSHKFRFELVPGADIQQRSKAVSSHSATVRKVDSVCFAATATTGTKTGAKISHWCYPELIDGCLYIRQAYSVVQDGETLEVV